MVCGRGLLARKAEGALEIEGPLNGEKQDRNPRGKRFSDSTEGCSGGLTQSFPGCSVCSPARSLVGGLPTRDRLE